MTDEHDRDPAVSQAYSELSTETPSTALDAKILQAARPSPRLSNLLALKPLSWAAITVLSIGLVLELQRSAPDVSGEQQIAVPMHSVPVDREKTNLESSSTNAPDEPTASDAAEPALGLEQPIAEPRNNSLRSVREEAAISETLDIAPATPAARLYEDLDNLKIAPEPERFCDDIERVDATSWYSCVLRLRDEGRVDEADFELSLLLTRFPDFEIR